jgi:hypothetical protein
MVSTAAYVGKSNVRILKSETKQDEINIEDVVALVTHDERLKLRLTKSLGDEKFGLVNPNL